ncbi:MAG: TIGR03960 family B12-binding radical SAM protein [Prochlorococcus sp.]
MSVPCATDLSSASTFPPVDFEALVDLSISKPGRYLGHELGVEPRDWQAASVRWALTYPEVYEVGASNSGHIILYSILNSLPGQLCDRAYLPAADLAQRLRERQQHLFAVESRRPLPAFDILGFSLCYELGATNILEMLDLAGVPIWAAHRGDLPLNDPKAPPLIFAGGPTATSNPEPYAAFFDFVALGDGEELLPEIGLVVAEAKAAGWSRSRLLFDLAQVPGVYVPSLYGPGSDGTTIQPLQSGVPATILRRVATPMPHYAMGLVPHIETVHDRLTVEVRRGCTRGCRFCQPGMLTRPARDVEPEAVIDAVQTGMKRTGYSDFSLLSLSCSDYLALPAVGVELRNRLADQNVTLQLPSQRVDRFDDDIAHILGGARKAGLTFAPEAGTQRLRDVVNKGLTNADLLQGIRTAMRNGYRKLKLYFMIGLPSEMDADVLGIVETCKMLLEECRDLGRLNLNITISNFTPKPHTPFQWHRVSTAEFERRQQLLRGAFRRLKGVKVNFTDVRLSAMEDFVGRGDRRLAPVIEAAWKAGAGMDAWFEALDRTYVAWTGAIAAAGLDGRYRDLELGSWGEASALHRNDLKSFCAQPLPWDHIDTGIKKTWLAEDLHRAMEATVVPDCSFSACSSCGVCGPELGHNVVVPPLPVPAQCSPKSPASEKLSRIRLSFAKTGPMALLSHLDVMRMLERALRRSGLPISYTGGFHPLPRVQIALALPLGVEAFGEWMDLEFTVLVDAETMRQQLQDVLPQGFDLLSAASVPVANPSLSQDLEAAIWRFELAVDSGPSPTSAQWQEALDAVLEEIELIWHDTDKKGRPRQRDCRSLLRDLHIQKGSGIEPANTAPLNSIRVQLEAAIDPMGRSIKPIQIQHWIAEKLDRSLNVSGVQRHQLQLQEC